MTKYSKNRKKINFGWMVAGFVLVAGATFGILFLIKPNSKSSNNSDHNVYNNNSTSTTKTNTNTNNSTKTSNTDDKKDDGPTNKTPKQYDGEIDTSSKELSVVITRNEVSSNIYQLRIMIPEVLDSNGICRLEMSTADGSSISREASIINGPSSATCDGFDIDTTGIAPGDYKFIVSVSAGSKSGTRTGDISI